MTEVNKMEKEIKVEVEVTNKNVNGNQEDQLKKYAESFQTKEEAMQKEE